MSRRVFVIIGPKGGSGATTVAFDLMKHIGPATHGVLVDGDVAGRRSHAVTYDRVRQLDENRLPSSPAITSGITCDLFEITNSYEAGFAVKIDAVEEMIAKFPLDTTFIADLPQPFALAVRPFLTRATRFIVVVEPTLLGVSATRQMLTDLSRFGIPSSRIVLVLNTRDGNIELKRRDIQSTLQIPVIAELPQHRDRGYAKAIETLAASLLKISSLEALSDLRPSASLPMGDRRLNSRFTTASTIPSATKNPLPKIALDELPLFLEEISLPPTNQIIKNQIHETLMSRIDFGTAARMLTDSAKMAELHAQVNDIANELIAARTDIGSVEEAARIKQEIVQEALGLGPIESLMNDDSVTEIMVNGAREVYIEQRGKITLAPNKFVDDRQVRLVIERILAPLGRRIDESSPMVDGRLPDGSRINATIPPLSIDGPTLTIRRFGKTRLSFANLCAIGALTEELVDFLRACVQARLNIVVSGGTGSGKTTFLNALSSYIPRADRIITIEDAAELSLAQPHVIRLETRPANLEGSGEIKIRDCVRNALRMRPDRIIVGECRGAEALDMLQAMNTGHDGSLTTIHANTPRDALSRIETMVMMAGFELPVRAIREQVSAAIDIVIQISRFSDGSRKLVSVSEVVGMEGDVVTMQELFRYRQQGVDTNRAVIGAFETGGVQPACLEKFGELGVEFDFAALLSGSKVPTWSQR